MHAHEHDIISESTHGLISYCPVGDHYELAYKNTLIVISDEVEFTKINSFFQNVRPKPRHGNILPQKKYIFRIAHSTTFFAFDIHEISEIKELLAHAQFQFVVQNILRAN